MSKESGMKSNLFHVSAVLSLALIVGGSAAFAQEETTPASAPPPKQPAKQPAKQKDRKHSQPGEASPKDGNLLSGPAVEVEPENGRPAGPDGPNQASKQRRGEQMPMRKWMTALRGVGLSEQQRVEVQAIGSEFQAAVESQMSKLTPEEREKVRRAMEQRRSGGRPAAGKPGKEPGTQVDPAVKELVKKIEEGRPNPKAYQERIWALLTPEQQAKMKTNLAELEKSGGPRPDGQGKRRRPAPQAGEPMAPMDEAGHNDQDKPKAAPSQGKPRDRKGAAGQDERSRRRAEFRRGNRSGEATGREPSADDREFKFDEEDQSPSKVGN